MCSNKAYVYDPVREIDLGHYTVVVARDVKDHSVALQHTGSPELKFNCRRGGPIGSCDFLMPGFHGVLRLRVSFPEIAKGPLGNDTHGGTLA